MAACCVPFSPYAWYHWFNVILAPPALLPCGSEVHAESATPPAKRIEVPRNPRRVKASLGWFIGVVFLSMAAVLGYTAAAGSRGGRSVMTARIQMSPGAN